MGEMFTISKVLPNPDNKHEELQAHMVYEGHDCPQINIYTMEGPLFFGAANRLEQSIIETIQQQPGVLLLNMGKVPYMDTTGESNLVRLLKQFKKLGGVLLLSEIQPQPLEVLRKTVCMSLLVRSRFRAHG